MQHYFLTHTAGKRKERKGKKKRGKEGQISRSEGNISGEKKRGGKNLLPPIPLRCGT